MKSQDIPDTIHAEKREIISKEKLSQLIRGPPGPPGPPVSLDLMPNMDLNNTALQQFFVYILVNYSF